MNVISLKAFLAAFLFTISLVITQQASAKVYTYEGEVAVGYNYFPYRTLGSIGYDFHLTLDINGVSEPVEQISSSERSFIYKLDSNDIEMIFDNGAIVRPREVKEAIWYESEKSRIVFGDAFYDFGEGPVEVSISLIGSANASALDAPTFDSFLRGMGSFSFNYPDLSYPYTPTESYAGRLRLISVVPEPSSYALLLAGLGFVSFVIRRKSAKK